ncbi:hypothetical protein PAMP_022318 [Pampus punctatissimus]
MPAVQRHSRLSHTDKHTLVVCLLGFTSFLWLWQRKDDQTILDILLVLWVPDYTTLLHSVTIKAVGIEPQEIMVVPVDLCHASSFHVPLKRKIDSHASCESYVSSAAPSRRVLLRVCSLFSCSPAVDQPLLTFQRSHGILTEAGSD